MKKYHFDLSLLAGVFLCLFWAPIWAQPQYQKTDLDALLGAGSPHTKEESVAVAINEIGHITGQYTVNVEGRAIPKKNIGFIYRPDGGIEEMVAANDRSVEVLDINDSDEVVGTWETPQGDREAFVYRGGNFESLGMFKKVFRINNAGDILGVIEKPRGALPSSIAVMKKDHTVIDILEGVTDCDTSVDGDCGLNRIDFDHWNQVEDNIDLNEKGEITFILRAHSGACSTYEAYSYAPDVGVRHLFQRRFCMTPAGTGSFKKLSLNDNGMVLIGIRPGGWAPFGDAKLYSIDGEDRTPGTVLDSSSHPPAGLFIDNSIYSGYPAFHTINNSGVIVGNRRSIFSKTDYYQVYNNKDLLGGSEPKDINNNNVIVGKFWDETRYKAAVWSSEGETGGNIQIDGQFFDWDGYASYTDATGDGSKVDWDHAWFAEDNNHLYISYSNNSDIDPDKFYLWNIYLDTDHENTGYRFNLLGADHLIQGSGLYHYTGQGDDWSWQYLEDVEFSISGARVEMSIDKASLNLPPSYRTLFYGANEDGSQVDYLLTDINPSGGTVILEEVIAPGDS
ncbi:MAG: hypothetical protein DSZ28_03070 [Thiothrix sp.]|nr:MAG: hypothetical protein DSZ28_03070 [Thiothrix sp.]